MGLRSESCGVAGGRGWRAGGVGRSWGRSVRRERPVRRAGSGRARGGARGAVPGVELLAVGERSHVVVAHEVTAAHSAGALVRHEALFDLQLRVGAQAQAGHGRCLPGHPEQQQEQRRLWGPPATGPERHRGQQGKERAGRGAAGAEPARARGVRAARGSGLEAAAFANVEKIPGPPRTAATTPSPSSPAPGHIRARGGAAALRGGGLAAPCAAALPGPPTC